MPLVLYNSLTRRKEPFEPLDPERVRMYVCGPTVYDLAHIGNARAVVAFDVLYRVLRHQYGAEHVRYVRNITDIDDKIIAASRETGEPIDSLTQRTTEIFHEDMAALGNLPPDVEPRATEHVDRMKAMIERLLLSQHAYVADGHVLFSVASWPAYGKLSRRSRDEMIAGARVEVAPYKRDPADFVLWKPSTADQPGWPSPWGRGRPGWHIECSAMSEQYLGESFDIHGGGLDLIFPHHENEIAQSECAHGGHPFVNYWVHNGFLSVGGAKMAKSEGNFVTVRDALAQAPGEVIRLALLKTHYRDPLHWTDERLHEAKQELDTFYRALRTPMQERPTPELVSNLLEPIMDALRDDLNVPQAISEIHSIVRPRQLINYGHPRSQTVGQHASRKEVLRFACGLLGVLQQPPSPSSVGEDVQARIAERAEARRQHRFSDADKIFAELFARGIVLEDRPEGTTPRLETTYWVQLWPHGEWDGQPYRRVDAASPKEAAEKLHGGPLSEVGSNKQIRAQVRIAGKSTGIVFYEP